MCEQIAASAQAESFATGRLVATPGAMALGIDFIPFLSRHAKGDWGDLEEEDKQANDRAISEGTRIFSAYNTEKGRLWIITEADRSSTCVLTPEEY